MMKKLCLMVLSFIWCLIFFSYVKNGTSQLITNALNATEAEGYLCDNIFAKDAFVNIYGLFQNVMHVNIIDDKDNGFLVKQDNGQLVNVGVQKYQIMDSQNRLDNMLSFNQYLKSCGVECVYFQMPAKNSKNENHLPKGVRDYGDEMRNYTTEYLSNGGMSVIDLRNEFENAGFLLQDVFFNTDHHWKPKYGFIANGIITEYLSQHGLELSEMALDINNYTVDTYKDWFLGSIGKRVGIYYAGVDDIDLIYPNFETYLSFGDRHGAFLESMIEYSDHCNIKEKDYFRINQYEAYTGGNYPFIEIKNDMSPNNKKIIIIKDSMSNVIIPYLALQCEYLADIDLRYLQEVDMDSMKVYVDNFKPDIVIFTTILGTENPIFTKGLID